jgi:antitoxin VapB
MYIPRWEDRPMKTTVFKNNRTQAVRIPKALAFPDGTKEVEIVRHGAGLLVRPKMSWTEYFSTAPRMPDDFMPERDDPPPEDREPL